MYKNMRNYFALPQAKPISPVIVFVLLIVLLVGTSSKVSGASSSQNTSTKVNLEDIELENAGDQNVDNIITLIESAGARDRLLQIFSYEFSMSSDRKSRLLPWACEWGYTEIFSLFISNSYLTPSDKVRFLTSLSEEGTLLHIACNWSRTGIWEHFLTTDNLTTQQKEAILKLKNCSAVTPLHNIKDYNTENSKKIITSFLQTMIFTSQQKGEILSQKNDRNQTVSDIFKQYLPTAQGDIQRFVDIFKKSQQGPLMRVITNMLPEGAELKEAKRKQQEALNRQAIKKKEEENKALQKARTDPKLYNLVQKAENNDGSALHAAAELIKDASAQDLAKYFRYKYNHNTALHHIAEKGYGQLFQEFLQSKLTKEQKVKFLSLTFPNKYNTPLHKVCRESHSKLFEIFLKTSHLDQDQKVDLLMIDNWAQRSPFMVACLGKNISEAIPRLFLDTHELSKDQKIKILSKTDRQKQNSLIYLYHQSKNLVEEILVSGDFTNEAKKNFLMQQDIKKQSLANLIQQEKTAFYDEVKPLINQFEKELGNNSQLAPQQLQHGSHRQIKPAPPAKSVTHPYRFESDVDVSITEQKKAKTNQLLTISAFIAAITVVSGTLTWTQRKKIYRLLQKVGLLDSSQSQDQKENSEDQIKENTHDSDEQTQQSVGDVAVDYELFDTDPYGVADLL